MRALICMFGIVVACTGSGNVTFTTFGEDYIEKAIPVDSADETGFIDGYTLTYDKFIVVIKDISLADSAGTQGPKQIEAAIVDLTQPGPVSLLTFSNIAAGKWDHVGYAIGPDAQAKPVGTVDPADAARITSENLSLWVKGSATNGIHTKTFDWTFSQDTLFDHCTNNDFGEGVTIPTGGTETVQLTIHGDHLWYDALQSSEAKLRFAAYADADKNDDGIITIEELDSVLLTALPLDQYDTGGAGHVKTLKDFVSTLTRTIGHYRGEGECEAHARQ